MPVCTRALVQVSPSMPTQADTEYSVPEDPLVGILGVGTVIVPVMKVKAVPSKMTPHHSSL